MKVFYCFNCKKIHISNPDNFTQCPECGGEIAVTDLSPEEWEGMSEKEQNKIIKYLEKQGRAIEAQNKPKRNIKKTLLTALLIIIGGTGAITSALLIAFHIYIPGLALAIITMGVCIIAAFIDELRKRPKKSRIK